MTATILERIIQEIVARILTVVKPTKVVLFGSAARGEMHENSDIDFLVVVPNGIHRRKTAQSIYRKLLGVGFAADIVVVTEEDIKKFHDTDGYLINPALAEGRTIYAA